MASIPSIFIAYSNPKSEISQVIQSDIAVPGLSIITSAIHGPDSSDHIPKPPLHESFIYAERHGLVTDAARLQRWGHLSAWAQTEYTDLLNLANQSYWKQKADRDMATWQHDKIAIEQANGVILEISPLHNSGQTNNHLCSISALIGYLAGRNRTQPILCITRNDAYIREHAILNGLATTNNKLDIICVNPDAYHISELKDRIHEWIWSKNVYSLRLPNLTSESSPVVLLAGPPGSGKFTLGKSLAQWLRVPHISTSETLSALPTDSELSKQIRQYLERGELVPAHIMLQVVHHRLSQPDCASGYILDGYQVDDDNFRHCKSLGLAPTDVIILDVSEELSVARQSKRSSRALDTNPDSARDRFKAYRKWMGDDPAIRFTTSLGIPTARTHVIHVDEQQTANIVLSTIISILSQHHIMHSPNWTTLTPDMKEFKFVVYSDSEVSTALDLHSVFPNVQFLIELKEDSAITGYIPGAKQSEKVAKYSEIHAYIKQKHHASSRSSLFKTIKESSQSANKLTTTHEYPSVNLTAAKLLTTCNDITDLIIQITMKWNKPKLIDYIPEDILDSLEILGACEISVASAITHPHPNTDKLKEQVIHIMFHKCNYNIPSLLEKNTFPDEIFKVLRNPPYKADEISYSISQQLHLAVTE
jgi:adenylate kinase